MKWLKRFGLPAKFTITFAIAIYMPLIIAGFFSFELSKESETKLGIKIFNKMADLEVETLKNQFDRFKSEITALSKIHSIQELLKIHEENPSLSSEKLMKLPKYKESVDQIEERLRLILPSNANLYGIGLFINYENIIALNEDKISHEVEFKKNVPIPLKMREDAKRRVILIGPGYSLFNYSFIFPFNKSTKENLDSVIFFNEFSNTSKKTPVLITFYNNPFIHIKKLELKDFQNQSHKFSMILKESKDGVVGDFNPEADNTRLIDNFIKRLPQTFLKSDVAEFLDDKGNIYTIRKFPLGLKNLEKISLLSFYPSSLINEPFRENRNLILKILALCPILIFPFLFFAIKAIIMEFKIVTTDLKQTSDILEKSTNEIQQTSSIIKKSNNDNKSRINEITISMDQKVFGNQNLKAEIAEVSSLSKKTSQSAMEGRNGLNELSVSMDQIIESSKNIFKIINIIENIAMQTNILSMNASVEAARAGEHGKGFAVVAEAIRNLAQKSSNSAAEIGNLIQAAIDISQKGSSAAAENRSKFKEIIENIEKLNGFVNNFSTIVSERIEEDVLIGAELKKINLAVSEGSLQTEKHSEIASKLSTETDALKKSIQKILIMVEGEKKKKSNAS